MDNRDLGFRRNYFGDDRNPTVGLRNHPSRNRRDYTAPPAGFRGRGDRHQIRRGGPDVDRRDQRRQRTNWDPAPRYREEWDDEEPWADRGPTTWDPPQRRGGPDRLYQDPTRDITVRPLHFDGSDAQLRSPYAYNQSRRQDRAWSYPPDRPRIPQSYFSRNSYVQRRCSTTEHYSWLDQQPSTGWPPPPPRRCPPRHVYSAGPPSVAVVPSSMRKDEAFISGSISYGRDASNSALPKVDRCSKTGSAPEMKAILETQFRKKRLLGLCSLRSGSGTDSLVNDNEFSHAHSSKYASSTNEMREQEEEMLDLPSLDAHMEYSFDNVKDFNYSSENEMVDEHSDNLGSSFLMDSRLEIEVDVMGDHGASNLDVAGVSNPSIVLLCDNHRVEEDRDASPEGPRVSSLEDIYLPRKSDETNIISPTPLPVVAFLHIEGYFRFLLQENAYDEGSVCLRICNHVVQEYIGKNLVYVAEECGTLGAYSSFSQKRTLEAYSFFRPKKITSGRVTGLEFNCEENLGLLQLYLHVPDVEVCTWRRSPFADPHLVDAGLSTVRFLIVLSVKGRRPLT